MSAPVLLSDYKMKKEAQAAKRESETPVTLGFMREFRAEILSRFSAIDAQFKAVDARFTEVDAKLDQMNAKIDQSVAEMKTMNHQTKLRLKNKTFATRRLTMATPLSMAPFKI